MIPRRPKHHHHERTYMFPFTTDQHRMASPILTSALLLLFVASVKTVDVGLGVSCANNENCVGANSLELVCDPVTVTCRIKDGQACTGAGHSTMCVAGAECTSGTCTCKASVYTANSGNGKCDVGANLWGGACDNSACSGAGLTCTNAVCVCETGKMVSLSTGTCSDISAKKIGHACTETNSDTDCGTSTETPQLSCPTGTDQVCTCSSGYSGVAGGDCVLIPASKVGHTCATNTAATDCGAVATTHLQCSTNTPNVCECTTGYNGVTGGDCTVSASKIGGSCTTSTVNTKGSCEDANALCSATTSGTCSCKAGYNGTDGAECTVSPNKIGGSCTTSTVNTKGSCEDANALCSATTGGTCSCKAGYTGTEGAGCTEIPASKVGHACTANTATTECGDAATTHLECSANAPLVCVCSTGYSGATGGVCIADRKVGGDCTGTAGTQGNCEDANALCSSMQKCYCKPGYGETIDGGCSQIAANTYGGSCTANTANTKGTCNDDHALCSATTGGSCTCAAGYTGTRGKGCAAANAVGGSCTTTTANTKGTCTDDNAVCTAQTGGKCRCKTDYSENSAGQCTKADSGTGTVVASATAVVMAAIMGVLFTA